MIKKSQLDTEEYYLRIYIVNTNFKQSFPLKSGTTQVCLFSELVLYKISTQYLEKINKKNTSVKKAEI